MNYHQYKVVSGLGRHQRVLIGTLREALFIGVIALSAVQMAGCPANVAGSENAVPVADAGADVSVSTGTRVVLDGSGSSDSDGDTLTYAWSQKDGPDVTLGGVGAAGVSFTPSIAGTYTFVLEVADGRGGVDSDEVVVEVSAAADNDDDDDGGPGGGDVAFAASWQEASTAMAVDLSWTLPSGDTLRPPDVDSATQGEVSLSRMASDVADGVHTLLLELTDDDPTATLTADVSLDLAFLGLDITAEERIRSGESRPIVIEVTDGSPHLLFSGWYGPDSTAGEPGSPAGDAAVEVLAGWRNASGPVDVDIVLTLPGGGTRAAETTDDEDEFGFERIVIEDAATLADGVYDLTFTLSDSSDAFNYFVDITFDVRMLGYAFSAYPDTTRVVSPFVRIIRLEIADGAVREIGNQWE